jgi:hypothetical protein
MCTEELKTEATSIRTLFESGAEVHGQGSQEKVITILRFLCTK